MKPTTEIVLGLRKVGAANEEPFVESMTVENALHKIVEWTLESTMRQRFQMVIAHSREDAIVGLGISKTTAQVKRADAAKRIADRIANTKFAD